MYSEVEYRKKIKELRSVAEDMILKEQPDEAREKIAKMNPEDAYIIGIWIGTITTQVLEDKPASKQNTQGLVVKLRRGNIPDANFHFN